MHVENAEVGDVITIQLLSQKRAKRREEKREYTQDNDLRTINNNA